MVGHGAREAGEGLGDVEPVGRGGAPAVDEATGIEEVGGLREEEVGVQRNDDVGAVQAVVGVHRHAEGHGGACEGVLAAHGIVRHPAGLGETAQEALDLAQEGG
ncbi:hypothetical protein D3C78_1561760 [compost metagenome]